jgi:hypothetical protein
VDEFIDKDGKPLPVSTAGEGESGTAGEFVPL